VKRVCAAASPSGKRTCTNCNPNKEGCQGSDDVTAWPHQILFDLVFSIMLLSHQWRCTSRSLDYRQDLLAKRSRTTRSPYQMGCPFQDLI
jgi:hypothetical protein